MTPFLTAGLAAPHGFFTRAGGVSTGPFSSLNCSLSADDRDAVLENRRRAAAAIGVETLVGVTQVHGADVAVVEQPWAVGAGPRADAMVTRLPGVGLGIITADCAPVLFAGPGVVGAAHAGWRGALAGVLEATAAAMGPGPVTAAIGPCIGPASYEVSGRPAGRGAGARRRRRPLLRRWPPRALAVRPAGLLRRPPARRRCGDDGAGRRHAAGRRTLLQPPAPHACRRRADRPSDSGDRMQYLPICIVLMMLLFILFGCVL